MIKFRKKLETEMPPAAKAEPKRPERKAAPAKDKPGADGEESQDRPTDE
jgi:hypothetical protein